MSAQTLLFNPENTRCPHCNAKLPPAVMRVQAGVMFRCAVCDTYLERVPEGVRILDPEDVPKQITDHKLLAILGHCATLIHELAMEALVAPYVDTLSAAEQIRNTLDEAIKDRSKRS